MPELPEVQCFVDALNKKYQGKKIEKIELHRADLRYPFEKKELAKVFAKGSVLEEFARVGKQIVLKTSCGKVSISLGMSGAFVEAKKGKPEKHEHVTVCFSDAPVLGFIDPRRFGFWKLGEPNLEAVDATSKRDLLTAFRAAAVKKSQRSVKDFLMDQGKIGGIGNIYALEALFLAGVKPTRPCFKVTEKEWNDLATHIPKVLAAAIRAGGSSISTYRNLHGENGDFQNVHRVYDRHGERCLKKGCSGTVVRVVQGGRGSWFCGVCQK